MPDRRQNPRDKVIYGGVAEIGEGGATRECVVRDISEKGARIEFSNVIKLPRQPISLTIARKGRSFLAKIIWWRDNFVGVAFSSETSSEERAEKTAAAAPHQRNFGRRLNARDETSATLGLVENQRNACCIMGRKKSRRSCHAPAL
jgi:hypothetical protein